MCAKEGREGGGGDYSLYQPKKKVRYAPQSDDLVKLFKFPIWCINVKKILAVIDTTYAAAKRKPEKIRLAWIFFPEFFFPDFFFQVFFSQLHKLR